ncbi:hypothetical protein BH20ACT2_BH20ACT2_05250 [soil metagenome]
MTGAGTGSPTGVGCQGVRIRPAALGRPFGRVGAEVLADADLALVEHLGLPPGAHQLWELAVSTEELVARRPHGPPQLLPPGTFRQAMWEDGDGRLHLTVGDRVGLRIDRAQRRIDATGPDAAGGHLQAVTTFAIPLLAHDAGGFVLHAAGWVEAGAATLVCAESGAGKSSLLAAAVRAGRAPLSEDLCVLSGEAATTRVWSGPPWVRLGAGADGPCGPGGAAGSVCFDAADKRAWSLDGRMAAGPVRVDRLVFLSRPGGSSPRCEPLPARDVVGELAHHTPWVGEPDQRAGELFGRSVRLAHAVPAVSLRLPVSEHWTDLAFEALADAPAAS